MRRRFTLRWPAGLGILVVACGFSDDGSPALMQRNDSAGIEVVRVLRAPPDTVRLDTAVVRIGSTDASGDGHEVFALLTDIVILSSGRIAIVDNRGARVAVFDSMGDWLHDIGRRGEGPGEYTAPYYASVRRDTIFVWDALQRRLSRYAVDGPFLGSIVLPDRRSAQPFAAVASGFVLEIESGQLMDPAPARGALVRTRRDGELVDTLVGPYPVPERGWVITNEASGMGHMTNPPALAIYPPWTIADGQLVRMDPATAAIEVRGLESGGLDRMIRLPYETAPPRQGERDAYFRGLQEQFDLSDAAIARDRATTEFAELRPPAADVLVDERGRFWVAEHDPAARGRHYIGSGWDVFDV